METPDDMPRTEEEWELYLRQLDVQSARLWDLLETLLDHPDRHRIIDEEMGWEPGPPGGVPNVEHPRASPPPVDAPTEEALASIPGYTLTTQLQPRITEAFLLSGGEKDVDADLQEMCDWLDRAQRHLVVVMTELQEAHRLGEAPHLLNGTIVHFRRAAREVGRLRRTLEDSADDTALTRDRWEALQPEVLRLEETLTRHVAALRARAPA